MTQPSNTSLIRRHSILRERKKHSKETLFRGLFPPPSLHAVSTCSWASPNSHWHTATPHPAPVSSPCRALPQGLPCYRLGFQHACQASPQLPMCPSGLSVSSCEQILILDSLMSWVASPARPQGLTQSSARSPRPGAAQPLPKAGGLRAASFHSSPRELFISGKDYALQTTLDYSSNHWRSLTPGSNLVYGTDARKMNPEVLGVPQNRKNSMNSESILREKRMPT